LLFRGVWTGCLLVFFKTNSCLLGVFYSQKYNNFLGFRELNSDGKQNIFKVYILIYIMLWWFSGKKEISKVRDDTLQGFEAVKKDINSVSGWIKHLDSERDLQKRDIEELKEVLSTMQNEIESLKNMVSIVGGLNSKQPFKTARKVSNKQMAVYSDQTAVQTAVQTPKLEEFSITERAILWVLLNTDMKLSYDDLAAMLGKEKSTIRGQINTIKQKSDVIEEVIEKNGKKRVFIHEEIKEKMLKKAKVRVKSAKKGVEN
jgi:predicted transcriptional regulator